MAQSRSSNLHSRSSILSAIALFIAIVLVIVRATSLETLRDPFDISPGTQPAPRALTAAASVVLDWIACVPALLILLRHSLDRSFQLKFAKSFVPLILLATWAAASAIWSNDRFAAVVGSAHFVSGVALFWAITQLVRSWRDLRLVAGVCFALLLCLTAYGLIYRFVELPDLQRSIERGWPEILKQRGWEPDSFSAIQFHKKIMSGESVGFSASPNTYAALLVMLAIGSIGTAIQRRVNRDSSTWSILIAIAWIPAAIVVYYTKSKAAFVTPLLAILCFIALLLARNWIATNHAKIFFATIALIIAGAAIITIHGSRHGNLGVASLTFRWRYWVGSARMIRRHPIIGVGWNNFADHYLAVREPIASEEIRDPHNLIVRFATELGAVGAVLAIAWLIALFWELTRPREIQIPPDDRASPALRVLMTLAGVAMALNIIASLDLSQDGSWVFIQILYRILYAGLLLIGLVVATFRSFDRQQLDDRIATWARSAIVLAIGLFLLHNTIDISFFETGAMWIFMMLAGATLGIHLPMRELRTARTGPARIAAILAMTGWLALGASVVLPIVVAENKALAGDQSLADNKPQDAARSYRDAYAALPFSNSDYLIRAARAQLYAGAPPDRVRSALTDALAANPTSPQALNLLARFESESRDANADRAIAAYQRALAVDPNDVQLRLDFANALRKFARYRESIEQYRIALQKNEALAPDEPKRLAPAKIDAIRQLIVSMGGDAAR